MTDKRTLVDPLHPENLIENGVYYVQWITAKNPDGSGIMVSDSFVYKGLALPEIAEDKILHLLLGRRGRLKEGIKRIFRLCWTKVLQMEYLHKKG